MEPNGKAIYISGPMRGIPQFNFAAFDYAQDLWESMGWGVFNPASRGWGGGDPATGTGVTAEEVHAWLRQDIQDITSCDAIALLPGWEESEGAKLEAAVAFAIGLDFYDAHSLQPLIPEAVTA